MSTPDDDGRAPGDAAVAEARRRWYLKTAAGLLVGAAVLFGSAGTLRWSGAWWYLGVGAAMQAATAIGAPGLLARRSAVPDNAKSWDVPLAVAVSSLGPMVIALVAGLDLRFAWIGYVPPEMFWLAVIALSAGAAWVVWAMVVNEHFEPVVNVGSDQRVVQTGPYRVVRHPGYLGGLIGTLAMPYVLGSRWAAFPAVAVCLLLALRTWLEDRTLLAELPGYRDYARRVRTRLIPGIW